MSTVQPIKTCNRCKISKPIEDFCLCRSEKDGHQRKCRLCQHACRSTPEAKAAHKVLSANWHEINKEKANAVNAAWRLIPENRAKEKERLAAYRATPEGRKKHRSGMAAYRATAEGRAKRKADADAYSKTPEGHAKLKERIARYRATPKGRAAMYRAIAKRRAIKAGASVGELKLIDAWEATWRTKARVQCHWCKKLFPGSECHMDHVIPISKHGPHDVENLVPSCPFCNQSKKDKLPEVFNATLEQPLLFF